jgi:hypothetical protein
MKNRIHEQRMQSFDVVPGSYLEILEYSSRDDSRYRQSLRARAPSALFFTYFQQVVRSCRRLHQQQVILYIYRCLHDLDR